LSIVWWHLQILCVTAASCSYWELVFESCTRCVSRIIKVQNNRRLCWGASSTVELVILLDWIKSTFHTRGEFGLLGSVTGSGSLRASDRSSCKMRKECLESMFAGDQLTCKKPAAAVGQRILRASAHSSNEELTALYKMYSGPKSKAGSVQVTFIQEGCCLCH
jgi:hypothetical protein